MFDSDDDDEGDLTAFFAGGEEVSAVSSEIGSRSDIEDEEDTEEERRERNRRP